MTYDEFFESVIGAAVDGRVAIPPSRRRMRRRRAGWYGIEVNGECEQRRYYRHELASMLAWIERSGPFRLAWLETMVRLADWRASEGRAPAPDEDRDRSGR